MQADWQLCGYFYVEIQKENNNKTLDYSEKEEVRAYKMMQESEHDITW